MKRLLLLTALALLGCESDKSTEACVACKQKVRSQLRLPDTADFPLRMCSKAIEAGGKKWVFSSHVEAKNAFGGTVREPFTCGVDCSLSTCRVTVFGIGE
jgi:hypothetical protein